MLKFVKGGEGEALFINIDGKIDHQIRFCLTDLRECFRNINVYVERPTRVHVLGLTYRH